MTETNFAIFLDPSKRFLCLVENLTVPETIEYMVSSPPTRTLDPGRKWDPRCFTMILPGRARSPSNSLTPRYFGFESRPYLAAPADLAVATVVLNHES